MKKFLVVCLLLLTIWATGAQAQACEDFIGASGAYPDCSCLQGYAIDTFSCSDSNCTGSCLLVPCPAFAHNPSLVFCECKEHYSFGAPLGWNTGARVWTGECSLQPCPDDATYKGGECVCDHGFEPVIPPAWDIGSEVFVGTCSRVECTIDSPQAPPDCNCPSGSVGSEWTGSGWTACVFEQCSASEEVPNLSEVSFEVCGCEAPKIDLSVAWDSGAQEYTGVCATCPENAHFEGDEVNVDCLCDPGYKADSGTGYLTHDGNGAFDQTCVAETIDCNFDAVATGVPSCACPVGYTSTVVWDYLTLTYSGSCVLSTCAEVEHAVKNVDDNTECICEDGYYSVAAADGAEREGLFWDTTQVSTADPSAAEDRYGSWTGSCVPLECPLHYEDADGVCQCFDGYRKTLTYLPLNDTEPLWGEQYSAHYACDLVECPDLGIVHYEGGVPGLNHSECLCPDGMMSGIWWDAATYSWTGYCLAPDLECPEASFGYNAPYCTCEGMFTGELLLDNITREWTGACTAQSGWNVNTVLIVDVFELRDLVNGPYDPSVDPDSALAWQFQTYDFISFHPDLTYNANIGDPAVIDDLFPNPEDIFGNGTHINYSPPADGVAHALTTYTYLTYYYLQDDLHGTKSSAGVFYVNLVEYSAVPVPINQNYTVAEDGGMVFLNFSSYDDDEGTQATTYCLAPDPEFRGNLYYIGDCTGYCVSTEINMNFTNIDDTTQGINCMHLVHNGVAQTGLLYVPGQDGFDSTSYQEFLFYAKDDPEDSEAESVLNINDVGVITVNVLPVNDEPRVIQSFFVNRFAELEAYRNPNDASLTLNLDSILEDSGSRLIVNALDYFWDEDPTGCRITITTLPQLGSLKDEFNTNLNTEGFQLDEQRFTVVYEASNNAIGTDTFTLTVTDPQGLSAEITLVVTIIAVNDNARLINSVGVAMGDENNFYTSSVNEITFPGFEADYGSTHRFEMTIEDADSFTVYVVVHQLNGKGRLLYLPPNWDSETPPEPFDDSCNLWAPSGGGACESPPYFGVRQMNLTGKSNNGIQATTISLVLSNNDGPNLFKNTDCRETAQNKNDVPDAGCGGGYVVKVSDELPDEYFENEADEAEVVTASSSCTTENACCVFSSTEGFVAPMDCNRTNERCEQNVDALDGYSCVGFCSYDGGYTCQNGGTCQDEFDSDSEIPDSGYLCLCPVTDGIKYTGSDCQYQDRCYSEPCAENQQCTEDYDELRDQFVAVCTNLTDILDPLLGTVEELTLSDIQAQYVLYPFATYQVAVFQSREEVETYVANQCYFVYRQSEDIYNYYNPSNDSTSCAFYDDFQDNSTSLANKFPYTKGNTTGGKEVTFFNTSTQLKEWADPYDWTTINFRATCDLSEFNNVWSDGAMCKPCPTGALCDRDGGFRPLNLFCYHESPIKPYTYLLCSPCSACPAYVGTCAAGYSESNACGRCNENYYKSEGECRACPTADDPNETDGTFLALVIVLTALAIGMLVLLATKGAFVFEVATVSATFFQTIYVLSTIDLTWPAESRLLFEQFQFFNLEPDMLQLECKLAFNEGFSKTAFLYKYIAIQAFPVAVLMGLILTYMLYTMMVWIFRHRSSGFERALIRAYIMFLAFAYLPLISQAVSVFDCQPQADGTVVLAGQTDLYCSGIWWDNLANGAICCCLLYGLGIPLYFVTCLRDRPAFNLPPYGREIYINFEQCFRNKFVFNASQRRDYEEAMRRWYATYSPLSSQYKYHAFYWELMVLFRKTALTLSMVFASQFPLFQAGLAGFILFGALLFQEKYQPYYNNKINILETITLMCCMSALLFGIMLSGDQEFPVLMISISGFIIISLIGLSMIYIVFLTAKMIFLHKKSEDKPVHYYPEDSRTGKPIGQAVPGDTSKADPKKKKSMTKKKSMSKKKKKSLAKKKAKKKEKQKRKSKKKKGKKTSDSSDDGSSDEEDSEGSEDVSISGDINTLNSPDGLELQSLDLNELENMDDAALAALLADGDGADLDEDALTALLEQAEEEPETKEEKLGDAVLKMKAASAFSILGLAGAVDPAPSDSDADSDVHVTM